MSFINLHNYTEFSILQSLITPKELVKHAKELGQTAVAITDCGSMAGIWDAYKTAQEVKIKLIVGSELYFLDDVATRNEDDTRPSLIVLLAQNHTGYQNLLQLTRLGFETSITRARKILPVIDWKMLEAHSAGLICLTGCGNGIVNRFINQKKFDQAAGIMLRLQGIFGDNLGIEIQTHNLIRPENYYTPGINQRFINSQLIRLAQQNHLRLVPTCGARYLKREQAETHDALLAIGFMQPIYSNARLKFDTTDLYLKSYEEVKAFFARNYTEGFAELWCQNTVDLAEKCENPSWIDPTLSNAGKKELPVFPLQDEKDYQNFLIWKEKQHQFKHLEDDKLFLRFRCEKVFLSKVQKNKIDIYRQRLEEELDVLYYCGAASYMLIVADFVDYARKMGLPQSPGRGSAGGSLVGYFLGIHQADPIQYGLVFERFHNKLKKAMSDIDCDFPKEKREMMLQYIANKYGKDKFAQISNFIYLTPKVYAKDISRTFELAGDRKSSVKLGDDIAGIIPKKVDEREVRSYRDIIETSPLFSEYVKRYPQLEKNASICGKPRSLGLHAAGIVITNRPVSSIVPTRLDKDGILAVQFEKDRTEEAGLVKMDILGLETLDIIDQTNALIKQAGKEIPTIDYNNYDKPTYDLISNGDTFGVFQFGTSAGTIDLCKRIRPKNIEDLAIITTIARPASKNIREEFIKVKLGKAKPKLKYPILGNALNSSFGFSIYDESLLVLAKDVAGWDLAEADKLRKLTKEKGKNPEKVEKWRQEFIEGAIKNGVNKEVAIDIWHNTIQNFGSYSFNKSHAVLYSLLSYHTAYLKAHFPIEFLLANLMCEIRSNAQDADKNIDKIKQELRRHRIQIAPPNINTSEMSYKLLPNNILLTGLDAIQFVGDDAIADIVAKRPFISFHDFILRTDTRKVRVNVIQALAATGCLDCFGISRRLMCLYAADYRKKLQTWLKKHSVNEPFEYPWSIEKEWSKPELYALEKQFLGEAFICNKTEAYPGIFHHNIYTVAKVKEMANRETVQAMKVEVKETFVFKVKKEKSKLLGREMMKILGEDQFGDQISLTVFPNTLDHLRKNTLKQMRKKLEPGVVININGSVNLYEDEIGVIVDDLLDIQLPPAPPKDLKAKKKAMQNKELDKKLEETNLSNQNLQEYLTDVEDHLYHEGLIDLNEEDDMFSMEADI